MARQFEPNFPHRLNDDGSYDSICTSCFMTVATARNEAELSHFEWKHVCDPIQLCQLSHYRFESSSIAMGVQP
jgi:hypothetical protein